LKQPIPFGKYLLLERINVGGMAEIFLARSRGVGGFKRILAIKKILPTMAEDEDFIAMFIDEARIAAELSHAGIVQIFELGKFEEDYYIAMEFIHGKDLRYLQERLARDRQAMDVHLAAHVAFKICEALDYAHSKRDPTGKPLGIIHRDISPQNVILSYDGEVKICDFGIAKAANRSQKTQAGVLKGKFGYMSPEQVRGLPLDGRSDIFTVGTLLYEMITLERLFHGESDFSTLEKVRNADVVPPSTYNRDVPEELEEIVLKALCKEVEDRFQSAAEMADALQLFMINHQHATSRHISRFMKDTFAAEFEAELRRLEEYQEMPEPELLAENRRDAVAGEAERPEPDEDAKTLIFASREAPPARSEPPPLPSQRKPSSAAAAPADKPDLGDAKTMVFEQVDGTDLGDAATKIFTEPEADEAPTASALERPELPAPTPAAVTGARRRSWAERLFLPLTMLLALVAGYAVFASIRLARLPGTGAEGAGAEPPRLELVSHPADRLAIYLDGELVAERTPYAAEGLEAGTHELRLERDGFEPVARTVELEPNQRLVVDLSLTPKADRAGDGAGDRKGDEAGGEQGDQGAAGGEKGTGPEGAGAAEGDGAGGEDAAGAGQQDGAGGQKRATGEDGPVAEGDKGGSGTGGAGAGPEPETPPPPAKATLVVRSVPNRATLLLNGRKVGRTPWRGEVNGGELTRIYLRRRGFEPASKTLRPDPGERTVIELRMAKRVIKPPKPAKEEYGYLLANTRPWSKVYVDGKYTGRETPIPPDKKLKLSAGKHRITFEIPGGKRFDFDVVIEADETLKMIKRLD
jgi:serine/threonine protein kinase